MGKLSEKLNIPYSLNMGFDSVDIGYGPKNPVYYYNENDLAEELMNQGLEKLEACDLASKVANIVGEVYNPHDYHGWWSSISC